MSRRRSALAWALCLVAPSTWAQARPWTPAERSDFRAAVALVDGRRYDEARAAFQALYASTHDARILFNLAATAEAAGDAVGALDALERFAREAPPALLQQRSAAVESARARLSARVGVVRVAPEAPDLRAVVDGSPVETSALREGLRLNPGDHVVRLSAPRHAEREERVTLVAGATHTIDGALARTSALVTLRCEVAGAALRVDDRDAGRTPLGAPLDLAVGRHTLVLTHPTRRPFRTELTVTEDVALDAALEALPPAPAARPSPVVSLPRPRPPRPDTANGRRTTGWITLGAGAAVTVAGAIFLRAALQRIDEADEQLTRGREALPLCEAGMCPRRTTIDDVRASISAAEGDISKGTTGAVLSAVGLGVGVAAMGVGVVLLVRAPRPTRVVLAPWPGGLTLRAVW